MKKLIELLNEYEIKRKKTKMNITDKRNEGDFDNEYTQLIIISKQFGFIKWLVDNDKIDLLRLDNRIALSEFNKVERVLMALSISDTPIEDLVSYLK